MLLYIGYAHDFEEGSTKSKVQGQVDDFDVISHLLLADLSVLSIIAIYFQFVCRSS